MDPTIEPTEPTPVLPSFTVGFETPSVTTEDSINSNLSGADSPGSIVENFPEQNCSCKESLPGPEGPQGPVGPPGKPGLNVSCLQ